jgi:hypothetical protein
MSSREAVTRLTLEQEEQWESIVRVAKFALSEGKKNMIVDLDILVAVANSYMSMANELVIRRGLMDAVCLDGFCKESPK